MIHAPFKKYRLLLVGVTAVCALAALLRVAYALLLKAVVDAATSGSLAGYPMLILMGLAYLVAFPVMEYLAKSVPAAFLKRCSCDIKNAVVGKITDMDINTFNANNSAKYISILNNDLKTLESDYYKTILDVILAIVTLPIATVTLFSLSPTLAVCMILLMLPAIFVPRIMGKKLEGRQRCYNESLDRYNAYIKDIFNGFETIVSFGIGAKVRQAHAKANEAAEEQQLLLKNAKARSIAVSDVAFYGGFLTTYFVAGALAAVGRITVGTLLGAI